jgi:hypothetical protein
VQQPGSAGSGEVAPTISLRGWLMTSLAVPMVSVPCNAPAATSPSTLDTVLTLIPASARLLFGHADRGHLRVGEDDPSDGRMVGPCLDVAAGDDIADDAGAGRRRSAPCWCRGEHHGPVGTACGRR